ncbi:hypothetical protein RND71_023696 [Anisodus tanguticus]|uniref:Cyclin-D1-binding protein 1-like N-terminal domain-containing protein n=1 Tax=Anisodus tanguticus TaxID=243964 RepID=A0AAE1RW46_9SOLA|nr:hypothetical protein RND71_023696 [Anisodus tanguticus]
MKNSTHTKLVGIVWEACSALKKTPATNITAIGRAMTQLAVSMKDVLREMNELKPAYESSVQDSAEGESKSHDSDDSFAGDVGNDLSPEEMKIARLITDAIEKIWCTTDENTGGAGKTGCSEDFVKACNGLRNSLKQLEAELDQSDGTDITPKIENLVIE